jgi:hypothetical protein
MAEEDMSKMAFYCSGFIGLFEWVVNQRAMNLIFHDLLGIILEIYINNVIVKLDSMNNHLANLRLALERIHWYGLKMNPLKCAFDVSAGKFI